MTVFKNVTVLTNKIEDNDFSTVSSTGRGGVYLLVLFQSKISFSYDGKEYFKVAKNSAILYTPYHLQAYKCDDKIFLNSFLALEVDDDFFKNIHLPLNTLFHLSQVDIDNLIKALDRISFVLNTNYQLELRDKIPVMLDNFFKQLQLSYHTSLQHFNGGTSNLAHFSELRNEMIKDPVNYSVKDMVDTSGYSATYFGVCYKQFFGVSPTHDRQTQLVKVAQDYLETTNYTLEKIAELLKLESVSHFIKIFKRHTHTTPHQYRIIVNKNKIN